MKSVEEMIQDVIQREGGYVDHPEDRGGPTNFGITRKTLSRYYGHVATPREVQLLSIEVAEEIYKRNYFYGPGINTLESAIQPFIFDCAVNHGPRTAVKFIQRVCNQAGYTPKLLEDGAIGPKTRKAASWAQQAMQSIFLKALIEERKNFYRQIVDARPSQNTFFTGWMNRVKEFEEEVA